MASFNRAKWDGEFTRIGLEGAKAAERYIVKFDPKVEAIGNPWDVAFARKPRGSLHRNAQLAALAVVVQEIEITLTSAPEIFYADVFYGQSGTIPTSGLWSFSKIGIMEEERYSFDADGKVVGGTVYVKAPVGVTATFMLIASGKEFLALMALPREGTTGVVRESQFTRKRPVSGFVLRGENLVAMTRTMSAIDFWKENVNDSEFYGFPTGTVHLVHDSFETVQQTVGTPGGSSGSLPPAAVFNVELTFEIDPRGWTDKEVDTVDLPDGYGNTRRIVLPNTERTYKKYRSVSYGGLLHLFFGLLQDRPIGIVGPIPRSIP